MRVLIVKTSSMGDVLHTLPALTDAAQAIPGIRFDWVVEEGFAQIPSWHESVERVIPVAIRRWRKAWFSAPIKAERQAFREAVQAVKYDAIIDAQGLVKSAALVTYAKPQAQGDYAIARHFLQHEASAAAPYLVFLHATTRDDKHWPETRWQELLDLLADSGVHIKLPWGAPHEEARAKRLAEGREYVEVLPRMSLEQVAQVLAGARAVVSVDTGLSHLTAALDKPNFTLYGPTDPGLIGGYGKNQHIVRPENSASTGDIAASRIHLLLQNQGLL
ncbi:MAG: glycosyltransferase family 9 protein [Klebsiella pneumoniae]|nr:glycosyltransferase family 9 protein [Klebsiella pneumoniae]